MEAKVITEPTRTPEGVNVPKAAFPAKVKAIEPEPPTPLEEEMTPEEAKASLDDRKSRIAQALTRGLVNDWLALIDFPPDRRGVWIRETDQDIAKFETLGYRVETEYGQKFEDHDAGDGKRRYGDCILMSTSMDNYSLIQEVEAEQRERKRDAGRREFLERKTGVPVFDDSEDLSPRS